MSFLSHTSLGLQVWQGISLFQIWCISCNERNKRFTKTGSQSPCMSTNGYVYYLKNDLDLQNLLGDECSKFGVNLIKLVALEHIGLTAWRSALNKADIQMHWHRIIFYQSSKYTSYMALNCNKPITRWKCVTCLCYMLRKSLWFRRLTWNRVSRSGPVHPCQLPASTTNACMHAFRV